MTSEIISLNLTKKMPLNNFSSYEIVNARKTKNNNWVKKR
jgi:hypothetical protein